MTPINFIVYAALVALLVKFIRTLLEKWGTLSFLQSRCSSTTKVGNFFYQLLTCEFCQSFWLGFGISVILAIFVHWILIFIPFFSCNLR
jgi:hypothetical protein